MHTVPWLHGKQKGKKWKQQQVLSSWASKSLQKVTAAMKLKMLAPWKESYDKPRKHMKSRDIILLTKIPIIVKAMVFPVVMYGCESWIIKKTEHWRIDGFELWCWKRLLWFHWTARKSNQSVLKEINPEYSLEGLMLKLSSNTLATWCKEPTHWKRLWCWERLKAGEGSNRGWDGWMASPTHWTWVWANSTRGTGKWETRKPGLLQSMGSQRVRTNLATEQHNSKFNMISREVHWGKW